METNSEIEKEKIACLILYKIDKIDEEDSLLYLLLEHIEGYNDWTPPKGKAYFEDDQCDMLDAAIQITEEKTGYIHKEFDYEINKNFELYFEYFRKKRENETGPRIQKLVKIYAAQVTNLEKEVKLSDRHNKAYMWVNYEKAYSKIKKQYQNEFEKAHQLIKEVYKICD